MNWLKLKHKLQNEPALLDAVYRLPMRVARQQAQQMRTFSGMTEAARAHASLPEHAWQPVERLLNPKPHRPRHALRIALVCTAIAIFLTAVSASGLLLRWSDERILQQMEAQALERIGAAAVRENTRIAGAVIQGGTWPWQAINLVFEYVLQDGEPRIREVLCISVCGERSALFPFQLTDYAWALNDDGTLALTVRGNRDYRLFAQEYAWTLEYTLPDMLAFMAAEQKGGEGILLLNPRITACADKGRANCSPLLLCFPTH